MAKECKNAWGSRRSARDAPSGASVPSTSTASAARRPAPAARPAADAAPDDSEPVTKDVEMCSGDEEVIAGAAQAAAAAASSSRPAPRRRRQRRNRGSIPFLTPGTVGIHRPADLSSLKMDLSVDDESKVSFLYTFDEVWRDQLTWEELRSLHHGRVLKKSGESIRSVAGFSALLFGSTSGAGPQPVQGTVPEDLCIWDHSPHWVALAPDDDVVASDVRSDGDGDFSDVCVDFGHRSTEVLEDVSFERFRVHHYEDFPDLRPAIWIPSDRGALIVGECLTYCVSWCCKAGRGYGVSGWSVSLSGFFLPCLSVSECVVLISLCDFSSVCANF